MPGVSVRKTSFSACMRLGDGRGGGVGVDVEQLALLVLVLGQRGQHGHHAGQAEVLDRVDVDLGHLADPAQVDRACRRRRAA